VTSYRLGPSDREEALRRLAVEELDVVVVGGGVVGAGAALDAATRGLSVGLLERRDWASGTSSRSSRLAHGGLRYLEQLEFGLVREALAERGLLLERLAPHLVRPVPFLLPLTRGWERPYLGAGVALYDVLSRASRTGRPLRGHRHLSRSSVQRLAPGLTTDGVVGAIGFYDAQIDDARHTLAVVRTAASRGALAASRVDVVDLLRDGERVVGVRAVDLEAGHVLDVHASVVVVATGVWSDQVPGWLGRDDGGPTDVVPSLGVHLVVPRASVDLRTALIARTPTSVLFLLPWGEHWLVGTTDTPWAGDRDEPRASRDDVGYLLDQANRWLVRPLREADVVGVYAGLRPLVAPVGDDPGETAKLSREHVVSRPAPGLVTVTGGKYTTYRVMAEHVVDAAARELPDPTPGSRTRYVPLAGAAGYGELWTSRAELATETGLPPATVSHLLRRHGGLVGDLLDLVADDPALATPVHDEARYLAAEVVHAVTHEDARHLDDVLVRRTRLALETRDGARSAADFVARLMAVPLRWDDGTMIEELDRFRRMRHGRLPAAVEGVDVPRGA
jgi:glycerol-3-phosphate dehydrogenase